jgi:ABC-type antimicrobial peptide transport system permease subunit
MAIILTILTMLSAMLIYSLLLTSIETRTFEIAVQRMVGMSKRNLIELLLVQSLAYAIPPLILGLIVAEILLATLITKLLPFDVTFALSWKAGLLSTALGLAIPILSAILPIRNALGRNLQEGLDVYRSKTQAVEVSIERSDTKFDRNTILMLMIGGGCSLFGFMIYYLVPLSLLSLNLGLFFDVFFFVLLGMLVGMIMIASNFALLLQKFLTLFYFPRSIAELVGKNLIAHKKRNAKTTIMYATALGFIMFIEVTYQMEIAIVTYNAQQKQGADYTISGSNGYSLTPTYQQNVERFLANNSQYFDSFSWMTTGAKFSINNLGRVFTDTVTVYGVSPNFFQTTYNQFFKVSDEVQSGSYLSITEKLYSLNGANGFLIGSGYQDILGLTKLTTPIVVDLNDSITNTVRARMHSMAFLESAAGFWVSKMKTFKHQEIVCSIPTYLNLVNNTNPMDHVSMGKLLIKFNPDLSDAMKDSLIVNLTNFQTAEGLSVSTWDVRSFTSSLEDTKKVMSIIFSLAMYIAGFLCLFSLVASMWSNIHEQTKEIAILRSLGLTNKGISVVYLMEALTLVMAASFLGIIVGAILGWTLTEQQALFTNFPLTIPTIPWYIVANVFGMSALCAILATFFPTWDLSKKTISNVMRMNL